VSGATVIAEIDAGAKHNQEVDFKLQAVDDRRAELARIAAQMSELKTRADLIGLNVEADLTALEQLGPRIDLAPLQERLQGLEDANLAARLDAATRAAYEKLDERQRKANELTRALDKGEEYKKARLAAAKMPVEGLSFDEERVLFNGIALAQCSGAERLRISTRMAAALNPEIRVILIRDGSLLDKNNLDTLAEIAEEQDLQIWLEMVERGEKVGFVIEDGGLLSGGDES
jgi:hypothetical protein